MSFLRAVLMQDHERAYFDSADWVLGKVREENSCSEFRNHACSEFRPQSTVSNRAPFGLYFAASCKQQYKGRCRVSQAQAEGQLHWSITTLTVQLMTSPDIANFTWTNSCDFSSTETELTNGLFLSLLSRERLTTSCPLVSPPALQVESWDDAR